MFGFRRNSPALQGLLALGFALALSLVALAGADHPPPAGFMLLVLACLIWCGLLAVVRWRLRRRGRLTQLSWVVGSAALISMVTWLAFVARSMLVDQAVWAPDLALGALIILLLASFGGACFVIASWLLVDARH